MDKTMSLLGLACRAGKLVLGEEVLKKISKLRVIFIASDISPKSRERYEKKCYYYKIPHIDDYSSRQLSAALGRNTVKIIGIADKGFADSILQKE